MTKIKDISCWVVTEGMAGTENQCLGVAEALGVTPTIYKTSLKFPWSICSPWLSYETDHTFEPRFMPPWPDLLLASGRKAIAAARYIKKASRGHTFCVYIQDPRITPACFDLVAVPFHDPTRGENVIVTDVAPNRITGEKLDAARAQFAGLSDLPAPRIAVLIGGKSKAYDMPADIMRGLIQRLKKVQDTHGASLMITASRRTGAENLALLKDAFPIDDRTILWDGQGDNPYLGYLSYADHILVTADSVSMISDALSTGKPTHIIPLQGGGRRLDIFHKHIIDAGFARVFDGHLVDYSYTAVSAATKIAEVIRNKMYRRSE